MQFYQLLALQKYLYRLTLTQYFRVDTIQNAVLDEVADGLFLLVPSDDLIRDVVCSQFIDCPFGFGLALDC